MDKKSPYERAPLRLKCVAARYRRVATEFFFGDTVRASLSSIQLRALTDGKAVYSLTLQEAAASKVSLDQTYMFKRLVLKGTRAYFNQDTVAFRSYDMVVQPELIAEAEALLCPPSKQLEKYEDLKDAQGYLTIKAQINAVSDVRQVTLKGTPLPVLDIEASLAGHPVSVTLWREVSLVPLKQGDYVTISHLRPTTHATFGFKMNSSVYTEVHQIEAAPSTRECTVVAVSASPEFMVVLLSCGRELKVPTQAWVGTEEEFLSRLPLTTTIEVQGDLIVSPEKLFETGEQEDNEDNKENEDSDDYALLEEFLSG